MFDSMDSDNGACGVRNVSQPNVPWVPKQLPVNACNAALADDTLDPLADDIIEISSRSNF